MKVFLDMDGVIAAFNKGINEAFGLKVCPFTDPINFGVWDYCDILGVTTKVFWDHCTSELFEELDPTDDAHKIVNYLEKRFGRKNICILSSPPLNPESMVGKSRWLSKHFPQYERQFFFGTKKGFAAHAGSLLIDDADHNIKEFSEAGGQTFLYPRPWNKAYMDREKAFDRLVNYAENLQC